MKIHDNGVSIQKLEHGPKTIKQINRNHKHCSTLLEKVLKRKKKQIQMANIADIGSQPECIPICVLI